MTNNLNSTSGKSAEQSSQKSSNNFGYGWIGQLLSVLDSSLHPETKATILRECASFHYHDAKMEGIVLQYRDDLEGFIQFLSEQWQWRITYDPATRMIRADENKDQCVCPLVQRSSQVVTGTLCHCSEGFAERMFSGVVGKPVKATVIRSVLRGDKSCVYLIKL